MSELMQQPGVLHRLRFTPLRDLLRLRLSGRLDWRRVIQKAAIDDAAKAVVVEVVERTRLWRAEKVAVAEELIAHFADAAEKGGANAATAVERFGDARTAAKLIRRAKVRNRGYVWHAFRWVRRGIVALLLFYVGVGVYFYMGRPSPSVDYVAMLNAPIQAAPPEERAWPLYRQALTPLINDPMPDAIWPVEPKWAETVAWLKRHQAEFDLMRQGAVRRELGLMLSTRISPEDYAVFGIKTPEQLAEYEARVGATEVARRSLIGVRIPQLNEMRFMANMLAADTMLAAAEGDAARVEQTFIAGLGLGMQLTHRDFLISDLVGTGIRSQAIKSLARVMEQYPDLLSADAMKRIAHQLARVRQTPDLISFRGERLMMYDVVQRTYTDDGQGNGRFTPEGIRFLRDSNVFSTVLVRRDLTDPWVDRSAEFAVGPASLLVGASRKELLSEYDRFIDGQERLLGESGPARAGVNDPEKRIQQLKENPLTAAKFALLVTLAPSLNRAAMVADWAIAEQEGLMCAMALELYRREHGSYPPSLDALVPTYMPRVPTDLMDGKPIRYVVKDNMPWVYSVGVDRDDDGGRVYVSKSGKVEPQRAADWRSPPNKLFDGDWVLFPQVYAD